MADQKRNITGSYPGKNGAQKPKKAENPAGAYPGAKIPARREVSDATVVNIPKIKKTAQFKAVNTASQKQPEPLRRPQPIREQPEPRRQPEPQAMQEPAEEELRIRRERPQEKRVRRERPKMERPAKAEQEGGKRFRASMLFNKETLRKLGGTLAYYGGILIASILLAAWLCSIGNEVLGLVRPDKEITVEIAEGSGTKQIAATLKKAGVIEHPFVFRMYCKLKKADSELKDGEFTLNSKNDYNKMIRILRQNTANKTAVSFKITAGDTQEDIVANLCDTLGYLEREELEKVLQTYDFSDYSFLKKLPERNYRLEGYLYPGKYEMYEGESALAVVQRILDRFEEKVLTEENQKKIRQSDYSLDELITLASILQKEGGAKSPEAAGVYFNRLADGDFAYLESNAALSYILPADHGSIEKEDLKVDDPYNTYRNEGLTPGAICSPSADAIEAVLDPEETDAFYFAAQDNGKLLFAESEAIHLINLKKAGKDARGTGVLN